MRKPRGRAAVHVGGGRGCTARGGSFAPIRVFVLSRIAAVSYRVEADGSGLPWGRSDCPHGTHSSLWGFAQLFLFLRQSPQPELGANQTKAIRAAPVGPPLVALVPSVGAEKIHAMAAWLALCWRQHTVNPPWSSLMAHDDLLDWL